MADDYQGFDHKVRNGSPGPEAVDHSATDHPFVGGHGYARGLFVSAIGDVNVTFKNGVSGVFECTAVGDFLMGRFITHVLNASTTATVSHGWL